MLLHLFFCGADMKYTLGAIISYSTAPAWWKNLADKGWEESEDKSHSSRDWNRVVGKKLKESGITVLCGNEKVPFGSSYSPTPWVFYADTEEDALAFILKWG